MAKCILHVGMHKTGTTSIQNSLQALDDGNFYYARMLAKPNHSVTISSIFHIGNKSHVARKLTRNGKMDADQMAAAARPELVASIVAANGRTLVISGEGILRMSREELSLLKAYLVDHGIDDIVVMAYVRAPVAYISSAMQQKLKIGNIRSLRLETCFPDYRDKFEKFDMVFGAGKVKLVKFDPEAFPDRDVVADFCQRTGIPPSSISPVRMNESITRLAAQLRFQYTSHADTEDLPPLKGAVSRGLLERCRGIDPTPFRMAPSVVRPFAARIQPDVEWMEKRLFGKHYLREHRSVVIWIKIFCCLFIKT